MEFASAVSTIVQAFLDFFSGALGLVGDWWALPPQKRFGSLLGFIVAVGGGLHSLHWLVQTLFRTKARTAARIEGLEAEIEDHKKTIATSRVEVAARDARIAELLVWSPAEARRRAERERREGNDDSEARILSEFIGRLAPDIADFSRDLAEFHTSRSFEDPRRHLDESRRLIHLAGLMEPHSDRSSDLVTDIDRLYSEFQVGRLQEEAQQHSADLIARDLGLEVMWTPETRIEYLSELAGVLNVRGLVRPAFLFMNRAAGYAAARLPMTNALRATTECWAAVYEVGIGNLQSGWLRFEKSWRFVVEALGERSIPALALKYQRAQLLRELGKNAQSLKETDALLALQKEAGAADSKILHAMWLRATTLDMMGMHEMSLEQTEVVLSGYRATLGEKSAHTLAARWLRANNLRGLDRHSEALDEVEALLPPELEVFGAKHPNTLALRYLRAAILRESGRSTEALEEVELLRVIESDALGDQHAHTLAARELHAQLLYDLKRTEESLGEIESVLPIRRKLFGEDNAETLNSRYLRALALDNLGRYQEAWEEIASLPQVVAKGRGEEDSVTLRIRRLYASILDRLGQSAESLGELDSLLPAMVRRLGERHSETRTTRYLRATVLSTLGRYADALTEIDVLLPVLREIGGEQHSDALRTRHLRASALSALGRHADSLREIDALLSLQVEAIGDRHPDTLTTRLLRTSVLSSLEQHAEALREIDALLPAQRQVNGERHPHTLESESLRLGVLVAAGRAREALGPLQKCIEDFAAISGAKHRYTLFARYRLARARLSLGHTRMARDECNAILEILPEVMQQTHPLFAATLALSEMIDGRKSATQLTT